MDFWCFNGFWVILWILIDFTCFYMLLECFPYLQVNLEYVGGSKLHIFTINTFETQTPSYGNTLERK